MAVVVHLVERPVAAGENNLRNDITSVLLAIEDTVDTTAALIRARAVTVMNAQGYDLPAGYFTTNRLVSTLLATAGEHIVFTEKLSEVV